MGDSQTYSLLFVLKDVLQVVVNSALKRMGDYLSDTFTMLFCFTECAASDGGDCGDHKLSSEKDRRLSDIFTVLVSFRV